MYFPTEYAQEIQGCASALGVDYGWLTLLNLGHLLLHLSLFCTYLSFLSIFNEFSKTKMKLNIQCRIRSEWCMHFYCGSNTRWKDSSCKKHGLLGRNGIHWFSQRHPHADLMAKGWKDSIHLHYLCWLRWLPQWYKLMLLLWNSNWNVEIFPLLILLQKIFCFLKIFLIFVSDWNAGFKAHQFSATIDTRFYPEGVWELFYEIIAAIETKNASLVGFLSRDVFANENDFEAAVQNLANAPLIADVYYIVAGNWPNFCLLWFYFE